MDAGTRTLDDGIPGVFEARQNRSVKSRDGFIKAGTDALNSKRFDDLKIADLAKTSGNSVGSFYTRFQDKASFFRALRVSAVEGISTEITASFTPERLRALSPADALDLFVDVVGAIFASRYRGVLRESYPLILDDDDPWEPIRTSARQTLQALQDGLSDAFPHLSKSETETRLSFCFQMVAGVMQNDLVNNYHVFTLEDGSILIGLKTVLRAYMDVPQHKEETP